MSRIRSFVERIMRLEAERKALADDIAEVYAEAKAEGWDKAGLKATVKRASADPDKLSEKEQIEALYWSEYERGGAGTDDATRVHVREAAE